LTGISEVNK
jgi:hypothetical protein